MFWRVPEWLSAARAREVTFEKVRWAQAPKELTLSVLENVCKTSLLHAKCAFYEVPTSAPPPPPTAILDPSRTCVLERLSPWAIISVVFSEILGVMAAMARLVARSGHLGHQK